MLTYIYDIVVWAHQQKQLVVSDLATCWRSTWTHTLETVPMCVTAARTFHPSTRTKRTRRHIRRDHARTYVTSVTRRSWRRETCNSTSALTALFVNISARYAVSYQFYNLLYGRTRCIRLGNYSTQGKIVCWLAQAVLASARSYFCGYCRSEHAASV